MYIALALAASAALLPVALSAPATACNALKFDTGVYGPNDHVVVSVSIPAVVGQKVTGTVVDLSTCKPYTSAELPVVSMQGQVIDADTDWSNPNAAMSGKTVEDTNKVSFIAEVPNGSVHLNTGISVVFSGGVSVEHGHQFLLISGMQTLNNFNRVNENVGIAYTLE